MEPYNVKIITFPDLTRQVRIYKNVVEHVPGKREKVLNPFSGKREFLLEVNNFDDHFDSVREVSLSRTKSKIYNYAKCNDWDFFVTLTLSPEKVDRFDYDACCKKLKSWLDLIRRDNPDLSYVIVPELHEKGSWHFHGLVSGLKESEIEWSGRYVIKKVRKDGCRTKFVRTDRKIYKIGRYKLGWMTATKVQDMQRAVSYITKYVTKDMMRGLYGRKRYWASRNLLVPTEEVFMMDAADCFVLSGDLLEDCSYHRVSQRNGFTAQRVEIFDIV